MFAHRELRRCLAQKQLLVTKSDFNRSLLNSEALRIRKQTERWGSAGAALAQKIGHLSSGIFPLFFARRSRLVSSAFAIAQAVIDFWPKRRDEVAAAKAITPDPRRRNMGSFYEPPKIFSAGERPNRQPV